MTEQNVADGGAHAMPPSPEEAEAEPVCPGHGDAGGSRLAGAAGPEPMRERALPAAPAPGEASKLCEGEDAASDGGDDAGIGEEHGGDGEIDGDGRSTRAVLAAALGLPAASTGDRFTGCAGAAAGASDTGTNDNGFEHDGFVEANAFTYSGEVDDAERAAAERDDADARREAALADVEAAIMHNTVLIYERADLSRAIRELQGELDPQYLGPEDEAPDGAHDLSSEDRHRLRQLHRIARARLGPRRRLIVGTPAMLAEVEAVKVAAPHFGPFIDLAARAVSLSLASDTPLRLPPTLLLGEPGIGKTFVLKRLAAALATDAVFLSVNLLDTWKLRGLNTSWKGACIGRIAETLLASPLASPVIVLDEFEKAPSLGSHTNSYDVFHSLLEEENAVAFVDGFLELPLRADHVIWVASANSTSGLPDSIVDRMLVLEVPAPGRKQLQCIVDGIYAAVRALYGNRFAARLAPAVRDHLARHNPRQLKRIVALALGYAAAAGRDALLPDDVQRAIKLAGCAAQGTFRHPIGFAPAAAGRGAGP